MIFNKLFVCEALLINILNTSPNVDHFPYCGYSNIRTYKEVTWTHLSFHPPSHLFDAWKELQSNAPVKSQTSQEEVVH